MWESMCFVFGDDDDGNWECGWYDGVFYLVFIEECLWDLIKVFV